MEINLNLLRNKPIIIDEIINIPSSYYQGSDVLDLKDVYVKGKVFYNLAEEIEIDLDVQGIMVLDDAITLEKIEHPFKFKIEENLTETTEIYKNSQNILDIIELLWENIVLEVPISLTKKPNLKLEGNGWALNGQEEENDSPLKDLSNLFKGGE